jgi:hypothetical protein
MSLVCIAGAVLASWLFAGPTPAQSFGEGRAGYPSNEPGVIGTPPARNAPLAPGSEVDPRLRPDVGGDYAGLVRQDTSLQQRDEARRRSRLAPFASVPLLFLGVIYAARTGHRRMAHRLALAAAVVATVSALGPVVLAEPHPLHRQPSPDAREYADAARQLASGNGYVTFVHRGEPHPPRYPPGFSLALTPFAAFGGPYPSGVQLGSKLFSALYVLAAIVAAWSVGGPLAAAATAVLVGTSPFAAQSATMVMSDAFVAALTVAVVGLLHRPSPTRAAVAGGLAGALVTARLSAVVAVGALLGCLPNRQRLRVVAFALPPLLALGVFHWLTFGSPLRTGYNYWLPEVKTFDWSYAVGIAPLRNGSGVLGDSLDGALMRWACPCRRADPMTPSLPKMAFYLSVLLGLYWVFAPPLSTLPGFVYVWKRRREPAPGFALWLILGSLAFHALYISQGARFMAAPATMLAIYSGVWVAERLQRLSRSGAPRDHQEPRLREPPLHPGDASPTRKPATSRLGS